MRLVCDIGPSVAQAIAERRMQLAAAADQASPPLETSSTSGNDAPDTGVKCVVAATVHTFLTPTLAQGQCEQGNSLDLRRPWRPDDEAEGQLGHTELARSCNVKSPVQQPDTQC